MWRGWPKPSFRLRWIMVDQLRVWTSGYDLWGDRRHVGQRGARSVRRRKALHVWRWGNWRALQRDKTRPCTKQTTGRGWETSWRTSWERTCRSTYLVT